MKGILCIPLLCTLLLVTCVRSIDPAVEAQLDDILNDGVTNRVYTGVAAMAGSLDGSFQYSGAFGRYKYPDDPDDDGIEDAAVELSSRFDLASCSKVVGGTSAIALLYERGYISLDMRVADILGEEFAKNGKDSISIRHCLLHNAGFAPDPVPW
jgi:serine-type D-Ala-D-Ala carboxypeptidase